MKPVVSVIIPVYNGEKYIDTAIQSVLAQTMSSFQLILVDDASTDRTAEILDSYSKTDDRIKIKTHPVNLGEAQARKSGVEAACGTYLMFLDHDDYLESSALSDLTAIMDEKGYDAFQFGVFLEPDGEVDPVHLSTAQAYFRPFTQSLYGQDIFLHCFRLHDFTHNLWDKIYKTELCKRAFKWIQGNQMPVAADLYSFFIIAYFLKSFAGTDRKYYHYQLGRGITGHKYMDVNRFEMQCCQTIVYENCKSFLQSQDSLWQYSEILEELNSSFMTDCVERWLCNVCKGDVAVSLSVLLKHWSAESIGFLLYEKYNSLMEQLTAFSDMSDRLARNNNELILLLQKKKWGVPFERIPKGSRLILYGAGEAGRDFYHQLRLTEWGFPVLWVDENRCGTQTDGFLISDPSRIVYASYDYILVAVMSRPAISSICTKLEKLSVPKNKIITME